ncbi:MAG: diaminopimelate epimerase [Micrococcaceae bacterium]
MSNISGISFTKGHGTGNDFIFINGEVDISREEIAQLCDRHRGLGADGLIRAVKSDNPNADWFMDYYNSDGSTAEMCGNGVRAFALYLEHAQLMQQTIGESFNVDTRAGLKEVKKLDDGVYSVDLGVWKLAEPAAAAEGGIDSLVKIEGIEDPRAGLSINMGNPHTVVAVETLKELEGADLTVEPDVQPVPVDGTNVELITADGHILEEGHGKISMRVHERGVGETLSCGTGIGAAAAAARYWIGKDAPDFWEVHVPGGIVRVDFIEKDDGERIVLTGPATIVADGKLV